ncbi:MAG TPA: polyketide synthase, partial [Thermoanaerobaculia bacterium]|nr:polyketide synthase [Thermoanaerobaculia bacterium]
AEVERAAFHKAIVLAGDGTRFMPDDLSDDAVLDLERIIVQSEIPVVAALTGNARGNAWLAAQLCDAAVYSRAGLYSAAGIAERPQIAPLAVSAFWQRLTREAAGEILLSGGEYAGATLETRLPWLIAADRNDVLSSAIGIAASWAAIPRPALADWKRQTAVAWNEAQRTLSIPSAWDEPDGPPIGASTAVSLQSRVVTVTAHPGGIAVVKMEDREARNMFSDALVSGVREAFAHIAGTPAYKAVILTGYDNYFASGGTRESLLSIQEGKSRFTDFEIFHAALECRLPVIAAMQGHGIGAGWSMGMLADVVLLSEESRYVSPYMNYGFTPGAGATYSLTEKMGRDLANESLLTGQQVAGRELKERGVALRVLPRADVAAEAMSLAGQMARRPRGALIALKQLLRSNVRETLEETYRRELAMHDETFVGRQDTLAQILSHFHEEIEPAPSAPVPAHREPAGVSGGGDSLAALTATLRTLLAQELQMQEVDIDEAAQFVDLGLDSITGVTWIRKINEKFRTAVEATKVYSYPTLTQLSRHVHEEAEKQGSLPKPPSAEAGVPAPVTAAVVARAAARPAGQKLTSRRRRIAPRAAAAQDAPRTPVQPIAIIGMAGQFPQARNIDEFWRNIAQGRNCITEVPPDRWSIDEYYQPGQAVSGKTNCRWAGTLEDYDRFDPLFFNISPTEAENMDPQQRLFLQACWHAIEDAGYDARRLSGSRCGVFVGAGGGDYRLLSREQRLSAQGFMGDATSILAARISYFLNLQGPSIAIDTACSSSLVALANACDSLTWGGSDLALAGGVYVMVGPEMHIKTAQAGMLSPDGKCYTFDQRANGFVPGEGVGVVLLKRLADAERDGDIIHAVIQGWGVNQDGKTNGITAPNPESQTRLEQEVYEKFGIDPEKIQLIEAHGTGTKLGDPIEVEGLKHAFRKFTARRD